MSPIRMLLVDDHAIVRRGLAALLHADGRYVVVAEAADGEEALLRPVFPWDAWSAWAVKPKTWMLIGHAEPYVSMLQWLADPTAAVRTAFRASSPSP